MFPRLAERLRQAAGTLSGGEQQMLAIGRCLMGAPELVMFDEPSLGLAPTIVQHVLAGDPRSQRARGSPACWSSRTSRCRCGSRAAPMCWRTAGSRCRDRRGTARRRPGAAGVSGDVGAQRRISAASAVTRRVSGEFGKALRSARSASAPDPGPGGLQMLGHRAGKLGLGAAGHHDRRQRHVADRLRADRRRRLQCDFHDRPRGEREFHGIGPRP